MTSAAAEKPLRIFSTCPQSKHSSPSAYLAHVADIARWSEEAGCTGMLVYTDNGLVDPWLTAQAAIAATRTLCPLVAVQPIYMHPYAVAKMVASLGFMHGRRIWLNMLAGGFKNDLLALHDDTPHDDRYVRTVEYTKIIQALLAGDRPVTFSGRYYAVTNLKMTPALPPELYPGFMMSGSSEAGLAAAREVQAVSVKYGRAASAEMTDPAQGAGSGLRVGIIARDDAEEAWRLAHERFPEDRQGAIAHKLATKVSDSHWHRQLSELAQSSGVPDDPYWLHPFQTYKTFCPYLVGDYATVAREIAEYVRNGFTYFVLDIPPSREELRHIVRVFDEAASLEAA